MTNISEEKEYSNFTDFMRFTFEQLMKDIYTGMPGIIDQYDESTKRARVIPALRIMKTDNTSEDRLPLVNVPVMFLSAGGATAKVNVQRGDAVMLMFSQRGLSKFKESFAISDTDNAFFDAKDAVAWPGFGGLDFTPVASDGIVLQRDDASVYVAVESSGIRAVGNMNVDGNLSTTGNLDVTGTATVGGDATLSSNVTISGMLTLSGFIFNTHRHPVDTPAGQTGTPIA